MLPLDFESLPDSIVVIIGVGRSGTSLLMTLLNAHSRIAFTPETHFLRFYLGSPEIQQQLEGSGPKAFQKILEEDAYFKRLGLSPEALLAPCQQEQRRFDLAEVYLNILSRYRKNKGKEWIGDKDPRYIDYLPILKRICPNARIIHIYRDPRDIVLSKMKAEWSAHRPFWLNAIISQLQIKKGRSIARQLFEDHYYELSYEALVSRPEQTLQQLLGFLGLDFEPGMFNLEKSARELVDPSEIQWKDNTFKPLLSGNLNKWKLQLSNFQIRFIELLCKEWFEELGYEESGVRVGPVTETLLKSLASSDSLLRLIYEQKLKQQTKQALHSISS